MPPSVGTRLGTYEIVSQIGAGGMGVVYKARDTRLDRLVALKFLPQHLSRELQQKQQLIKQARAASPLDHLNIGVVHQIGETPDSQVFITMACYEGESLKQRIAVGLPHGEATEIARQIAVGLDYAHRHGVIHRDIKPGNVVLTGDGVVTYFNTAYTCWATPGPRPTRFGSLRYGRMRIKGRHQRSHTHRPALCSAYLHFSATFFEDALHIRAAKCNITPYEINLQTAKSTGLSRS